MASTEKAERKHCRLSLSQAAPATGPVRSHSAYAALSAADHRPHWLRTAAQEATSLATVITLEDRGQTLCFQSYMQEGVEAFKEKRKPSYSV